MTAAELAGPGGFNPTGDAEILAAQQKIDAANSAQEAYYAFLSYTETYQELYLSSSGLLLLPLRDEPLQLQISVPSKLGYWLGWQTRDGVWKFFVKAAIFTANQHHKCSMFRWSSTE